MWPQQFISSVLLNFITQQVCYDGYGCFSNTSPYDISLALLPQDPIYLNTKYHVHSRGGERFKTLQHPFHDLSKKIEKKSRTFIVTHGFIEHSRKFWVQPMIDALLNRTDSNVIFVDWEKGAEYPFNQAFGDSRIIAVEIAKLIEVLHLQRIADVNTIHLIGFSLGAHMMGRVGHILKDKGHLVDQITGLDPAGPVFENCHRNVSLDKGDAKFVDVIHSDASTPLLGTLKRQGHADFYPNGGLLQPGCKRVTADVFSKEKIFNYVSCSHYRAVFYFIYSINLPKAFKSYKCQNYKKFMNGHCHGRKTIQHMGFNIQGKASGKYYLLTRDEQPFTGYHYFIQIMTGSIAYSSFNGMIQFKIHGDKDSSKLFTLKRDIHENGSTVVFVFLVKKHLGNIRKISVKADTGIWFNDKWFVTNVSLKRFGGKRWKGCNNQWIGKKFVTIKLDGIKCPKQSSKKLVETSRKI